MKNQLAQINADVIRKHETERPARTETGKPILDALINASEDLSGSPHESPDTTRRQAAHGPLPDSTRPQHSREEILRELDCVRNQRNQARDHADKLAGALRNALNMIDPFVWNKGKEAAILEAYEKESK